MTETMEHFLDDFDKNLEETSKQIDGILRTNGITQFTYCLYLDDHHFVSASSGKSYKEMLDILKKDE